MKFFESFFKKRKNQEKGQQISDILMNLPQEELKMIKGVIGLSDTQVHEILKPRIDVVTVDVDDPLEEIINKIVECGHSRIPVYKENIDNIVGVLYAKDLLSYFFDKNKEIDIKKLLREPFFVPETKSILELLKEFREKKVHIALVVDEYGGFSGIVCLEDILEEIVGEIRDEYDHEKEMVIKMDENKYRIYAKITISDLNEKVNCNLPEDVSDSLSGFIMEILGRIPKEGEIINYKNIEFKIDKMSSYKIDQIIMKILPENEENLNNKEK